MATWSHAAAQVRQSYGVFGSGMWFLQKSDNSRSKSRQYHKARAKLVIGNLLTAGLINLALMVKIKSTNEKVELYKLLDPRIQQLAEQAARSYNLTQPEFRSYMKYKITGIDKPKVRPSTDRTFAQGWAQFVHDHGQQLRDLGIDV